jgi:valyl-tRNA synthetase
MSKSKGTGVDPLELIDQHGADALRFALVLLSTGSQDIRFGRKLSVLRAEMARNFTTKLWNACRYVAQRAGTIPLKLPEHPGMEERWILSRLSTVASQVTAMLGRFEFSEAGQLLYKFVWNDFCDWYIELSKRRVEERDVQSTLAYVVDVALRLLHPMIPYVTEDIWQRLRELGAEKAKSIMISAWPELPVHLRDEVLEEEMDLVFECVAAIREKRNSNKISPKVALHAVISAKDDHVRKLLEEGRGILVSQAGLGDLRIGTYLTKPPRSLTAVSAHGTIYLPMGPEFDAGPEKNLTRKELIERMEKKERLQQQLGNTAFRLAKPDLVAKLEEDSKSIDEEVLRLESHLKELEEL